MLMIKKRRCSNCKQEKPETIEFFYWHKTRKYFRTWCVECIEKKNKAYKVNLIENDPDRFAAMEKQRSKRQYDKHGAAKNAALRERRATDPDFAKQEREYQSQWRRDNPEKYAQQKRQVVYSRHNLTESDFLQMLREQQHGCAICRTVFIKTPRIDHDHITGKVRGLLCDPCNQGIGFLKDDRAILQAAINDLEQNQ